MQNVAKMLKGYGASRGPSATDEPERASVLLCDEHVMSRLKDAL